MTRLDAPAMSRQLAVACRRSNPARRRRWWPFAARAHSREADSWVNLSLRLPVTGWCAYLGGLAVQQPRASGLLEVLTVVLVQARVTHMRSRLEQSDDLAQPAQLPVAGADVFDLQLRAKLWRKACWPACDATAFWSIYWHASNISGMWLWPWLPIIAATYALMIVAAALVCYRFRVSPGFLPTAILEAAAVILAKQLDFGWIKDGIDMVVLIADWWTPWGWLKQAVLHLEHGALGGAVAICLLFVLSAIFAYWAYVLLRQTWTIAPQWREASGRPSASRDEQAKIFHSVALEIIAGFHAQIPGPAAAAQVVPIDQLWISARQRMGPAGASVEAGGWPGRIAVQHFDADDRRLADLLGPVRLGDAAWRWSLLFAGAPAACALCHISLAWSMIVIGVCQPAANKRKLALVLGLLGLLGLASASFEIPLGLLVPCVTAVVLARPWWGWKGLPLTSSVLGGLPKTWRRLMRILVLLRFFSAMAAMSIVAIFMLTLAQLGNVTVALFLGTVWLLYLLSGPWRLAIQLIQSSRGQINLPLGRAWLSLLHWLLFFGLSLPAIFILGATIWIGQSPSASYGTWHMPMILVGGGLLLACAISVAMVALLRRSYRQEFSFIPPP